MESWKIEEIKLLRSDIEERLQQMGLEPELVKALSGDVSEYGGQGSEADIYYLNARFNRIKILTNSDQR